MTTSTPDPTDATPERPRPSRRLQPLRKGEFIVLTDRQAEDHARRVHGGDTETDLNRPSSEG